MFVNMKPLEILVITQTVYVDFVNLTLSLKSSQLCLVLSVVFLQKHLTDCDLQHALVLPAAVLQCPLCKDCLKLS